MSSAEPRVAYSDFREIAPAAYAGLFALSKSVHDSGLDDGLVELVKIRASQINGCAFCIQHHLNVARKLGVEGPKLDLLSAWREAGVYSPREHAALRWAEGLTRLDGEAASEEAWSALRAEFTEVEAVFLTVAIGSINAWNRIGASLRFAPPIPA